MAVYSRSGADASEIIGLKPDIGTIDVKVASGRED
jgi:hypothetical protein